MITLSLAPGTACPVQLLGFVHDLPSPPPDQLIVAGASRFSRSSTKSFANALCFPERLPREKKGHHLQLRSHDRKLMEGLRETKECRKGRDDQSLNTSATFVGDLCHRKKIIALTGLQRVDGAESRAAPGS